MRSILLIPSLVAAQLLSTVALLRHLQETPAAVCKRGEGEYQFGARIPALGRNKCIGNDDAGRAVAGFDVCGKDGVWKEEDIESACLEGETCKIGEQGPACVPVQCQYDDGIYYDAGTRFAAPEGNFCLDDSSLAMGGLVCSIYGNFQGNDEVVRCAMGENCKEEGGTASCAPIQCQKDGTSYLPGDRALAYERNTCVGSVQDTAIVAFDVCGDGGVWEQDDTEIYCFDGEICEVGDQGPSCVPVQCQHWDGTYHDVFTRLAAPEYNFCWGRSLFLAYDECTENGQFDEAYLPVRCTAGEHCVEADGTASCEPM